MTVAFDEHVPPVSGRHQNRALASARRNRCFHLASEGRSYEQIREQLGYANRAPSGASSTVLLRPGPLRRSTTSGAPAGPTGLLAGISMGRGG